MAGPTCSLIWHIHLFLFNFAEMVRAAVHSKSVNLVTEALIQKACKDSENEVFSSVTSAAQHYKVPYHTLWHQYNGCTVSKIKAHKYQLLLTPAQEETLVD